MHSVQFRRYLRKLAKASTNDAWLNHFRKLDGRRIALSKSRYMAGLQCHMKLWQTVYDPDPVEEARPGTVKWMGTEVGIRARLLWPNGVLVDPAYNDYAEAVRRTKALIADPTLPAILKRAWSITVCSFELMLSNASLMAAGG